MNTSQWPQELEQLRLEIDTLDAELLDVVARRFEVVKKVGALKAREGLPIVQAERAAMVIERAGQKAAERGVNEQLMRAFYTLMIDVAHEMEYEIADQKGRIA